MVACASHMLQPAKCNYSTVEQEALACVWGQRSSNATCGGTTLPSVLITMLTFPFQGPAKAENTRCSSKLVWWAERLSAFDLDVQYVRGLDSITGRCTFVVAIAKLRLCPA